MPHAVLHHSRDLAQAQGDFEQQVCTLRTRVYRLAFRMLRNHSDAQDIAQETFVRAWAGYAHYDPDRSFEAWLFRITRNLCIDHARRHQRRQEYSLDTPTATGADPKVDGIELADRSQDPQTLLLAAEIEKGLQRYIQELPPAYRACVLLLQHDCSYEEIARRLHCPVGTIRSRVHRARTMLRRALAPLISAELPDMKNELSSIVCSL